MEMTILYFTGTIAAFIAGYFLCKSKYKKEINRLKRLNQAKAIPFDDYARYQKAYVEYYKWINSIHDIHKVGHSHSTFKLCRDKFEELFTDKNN